MIKALAATAALSVALTACGGGSPDDQNDPTLAAPPAATQDAPEPSPSPLAEEPTDGAAVVDLLAAAGLPVKLTVDYDESTDPNKQLGRPNGYQDKVAFVDARIDAAAVIDDDEGSVELGGSVEVFATEAEAQRRADYIKTVTAGTPALTEYGYVSGGILLRLSQQLTPKQAKEYEAALHA